MNRRWLSCFWLAALAASAFGETWYVNNKTGRNTNHGKTETTAFATIGKALSACKTSDKLVLANTGVAYRESIRLAGLGGTPAKPFVIEGNGAVISGFKALAPEKWQAKENGTWFYEHKRPPMRPYLRLDGKRVQPQRKPDTLKPGQYCWAKEGIHFRPEEGKTPRDYDIVGTFYSSGLQISNASYIRCTNLIAEGFPNDGFNVHGECQGIHCENIEGRYNGDDGFSIHEDISAVVYNGWFHHNDYGIQDVNAGRSIYFGILAENNRRSGVEFHGGLHMLVDAVVRDNAGVQVKVAASQANHIGFSKTSLAVTGLSVLKNVAATGGQVALDVQPRGSVFASNCLFREAVRGVSVGPEASCHLTACVIYGCEEAEMATSSKNVELVNNLYHPGRFIWLKKRFDPSRWEAYRKATGQDEGSRLVEPVFMGDGSLRLKPGEARAARPQLQPGLTRRAYEWAGLGR